MSQRTIMLVEKPKISEFFNRKTYKRIMDAEKKTWDWSEGYLIKTETGRLSIGKWSRKQHRFRPNRKIDLLSIRNITNERVDLVLDENNRVLFVKYNSENVWGSLSGYVSEEFRSRPLERDMKIKVGGKEIGLEECAYYYGAEQRIREEDRDYIGYSIIFKEPLDPREVFTPGMYTFVRVVLYENATFEIDGVNLVAMVEGDKLVFKMHGKNICEFGLDRDKNIKYLKSIPFWGQDPLKKMLPVGWINEEILEGEIILDHKEVNQYLWYRRLKEIGSPTIGIEDRKNNKVVILNVERMEDNIWGIIQILGNPKSEFFCDPIYNTIYKVWFGPSVEVYQIEEVDIETAVGVCRNENIEMRIIGKE